MLESSVEDVPYRVLGELGRGGQAVVKLAVRDFSGDEIVVLKAPHEDLSLDNHFAGALAREARVMVRMQHPNICSVAGLRQFRGELVMEMEYLPGQTLRRVLAEDERRGGFPLHLKLRTLGQVLEALDYAHRLEDEDGRLLNIVHRDVSPHNIMLTYDGRIKLLDFGIAKHFGATLSASIGSVKGKLAYMPPEQLDSAAVEPRSDLFAVGVMLWEVLAGRRLWDGLESNAIIHHLTTRTIPDLFAVNPRVPEELGRLCMRAVAADVDERPSSARVFLDRLRECVVRLDLVTGNRAVGHAVTEMFGAERKQMQSLIEAELRKLVRPHSSEVRRRSSRPTLKAGSSPCEVMVIDDSELSRSLMTEILEENGIRAIALPTALDAMQVAIKRNIRVIVSDVNMPALPGPALVRQIRKNPRMQHVKVFLTSALAMDELTDVGADGTIEKDRLEDELVPVVRRALTNVAVASY